MQLSYYFTDQEPEAQQIVVLAPFLSSPPRRWRNACAEFSELCFAGPREPAGVAVGHQRAPPARQESCHETQEAPCPQAKPTRGRPALRPITCCAGAPCHLAPRLRQRSFPAGRPGSCGASPPPPPRALPLPHPPTLATRVSPPVPAHWTWP